MEIKGNDKYKDIVELFESLVGSRSMWQVYSDVIKMIACALQNSIIFNEKIETIFKDTAKEYNEKEREIIDKIYYKIVSKLEENPFQDLLGDLYMNLEMGSDALGQFFTPYHISKTMAKAAIDIDYVKKKIDEEGYVKLYEPTSGSGSTVIAACEILKNEGINYQRKCVFVCQELNKITALMCYIALSLIGCSAVVKIDDTLTESFSNYKNEAYAKKSDLWTTPMFWLYSGYNKV